MAPAPAVYNVKAVRANFLDVPFTIPSTPDVNHIMTTKITNGVSQAFEKKWIPGTDPKEGKWPGLRPNAVETVDGMHITWDVAVPMRDGVKLYADVLRPEGSEDEKLPIIITYSPYGKHGPKTFDIFPNAGVPKGSVSKYAVWEGPDPFYWTKKGYAVINADCRGSWGSEGDCEILSAQQGQDGYDLVEWAAALPWSNGRVGIAGVSYLAIIQWRVAELNPPHLSCIMPWEGFSDVYRDYSHHGGIPETKFVKFMEWSARCSLGKVEDWVTMQKEHYLLDEYQETKRAKLSQISCPAYVVADWGDQGLHTRGTLLAFENISSEQKWLEVHGRKKWQYYYQPSSLRRQEAFFQKFLKNEESEIDEWPRVLLEVRDRAEEGIFRGEQEWPLQRTNAVVKYLDAASMTLVDSIPRKTSTAKYKALSDERATFTHTFDRETELTGGMRLRLWISTDVGDDMDVFAQLDKLDASGAVVPFISMSMIDDGPLALGWIRASHRELDPEKSRATRPWLCHERELPLREGEIVPVDIEIWPSSTRFAKGESLVITVAGKDIFTYDLAQCQLHEDSRNEGTHSIHTGATFDSYLVMPVVE